MKHTLVLLAAMASSALASPLLKVNHLLPRAPSDSCAAGVGASPSGAPGQVTSRVCSANSDCGTGICCTPTSAGINEPRCIGYGFGSTCSSDGVCGSDYCLRGECRSPGFNTVGLGEHCKNDNCSSGLSCVSGYCEAPAPATGRAVGDACTDSPQCASNICGNGSCVANDLGVGASCIYSIQCAGPINLCVNGTCELRQNQSIGATCEENANCESNMCYSAVCVANNLAVGETCVSSSQCAGINLCESGTCRLRTGMQDGLTCDVAANCTGGFCIAGQCRSGNKAAGERCTVDAQCNSGSCTGASGSATCATPAPTTVPNGQGCTANTGCQSGLCYQSTCRARNLSNNSDCLAGVQCTSGTCTNGKCVTPSSSNPNPPANNNPGNTVTTTIVQNGVTQTVTSVVGQVTGSQTTGAAKKGMTAPMSGVLAGVVALVALL